MGVYRSGRSWFAFGALATAAAVLGASAPAVDDGAAKKADSGCCACCTSKAAAAGFSGVWSGEYKYPEGSGQRPVAFTAFLIQEGDRIKAMIKEANTFGDQQSPWLHATAEGRYDGAARSIRFVKSYDGTAGASHDVSYTGTVASDGSRAVEGTWDIQGFQGTFTMRPKAVVD